MIRVGSLCPSGVAPLESLWEGAKILVADWINHLAMLVIDGPNQPIRSTKRMTWWQSRSFREGILSNSAQTCSIAARISITSAEAAMLFRLKSRSSLRHTWTRRKTNADWPLVWRSAPNDLRRVTPVWTVSGTSRSWRGQAHEASGLPD